MKTKVVQHVKSEWMREWKSVRVRERVWEWECVWEWERVRVTSEHRHENKGFSACQEWVNERVRVFNNIPGSQLLSDVQNFYLYLIQMFFLISDQE